PVLIKAINSDKANFNKQNGIIHIPSRRIKVICNESTMMTKIECDVSSLNKGDVIRASHFPYINFHNKNSIILTIIDK
ncbi:MAG: hypothetical protein ACK5XN_12125, partial [Bacteroidota bacterium]